MIYVNLMDILEDILAIVVLIIYVILIIIGTKADKKK